MIKNNKDIIKEINVVNDLADKVKSDIESHVNEYLPKLKYYECKSRAIAGNLYMEVLGDVKADIDALHFYIDSNYDGTYSPRLIASINLQNVKAFHGSVYDYDNGTCRATECRKYEFRGIVSFDIDLYNRCECYGWNKCNLDEQFDKVTKYEQYFHACEAYQQAEDAKEKSRLAYLKLEEEDAARKRHERELEDYEELKKELGL